MKKLFLAFLCMATSFAGAQTPQQPPTVAGDDDHAPLYETPAQRDARMKWWRDAKFGMFIHYGIYSGLAGEFKGRNGGAEWLQTNLGLDTDTYAAEALPLFKPVQGCTKAWAELAREGGCRYMVLTTKHHDGFAMFDTPTSDYNAAKVAGWDIVREYVESARANGLRVGFYHSVIDWHHPSYDYTISRGLPYPKGQAAMLKEKDIPRDHDAYTTYLYHQARELLSNYGKVDVIWWDYSNGALSGARGWRAPQLIEMARELQPGIIMNNRLYSYSGYHPENDTMELDLRCGDFMTPEKRLPKAGCATADWESCMTLGNHWGFNKNDKKYKSPTQIIRQLQQCAAFGGNLLLNISPRVDGSIPEAAVDIFRRVGKWLGTNGEAIYASRPVPGLTLPEGWLASVVGEETYLFPPALKGNEENVVLLIPAHEIDTVSPSVLGQADCEITIRRIEKPGEDEPQAFMELTIPASAWKNALEGMPVIKLTNAH